MAQDASLIDFWRDCQAAGELRLLVDRPPSPARGVILQTPFAVLGRDDACDIALKAPEISRRHAYLQVIAGELWCFDLASRTGLFLGDERLAAATVTGADGVRLGPCRIQPLSDADFPGPGDPDPLAPLPESADRLPAVTLEFTNATHFGGGPPPAWQLDRTVTFIGQSLQCKVRFKCTSVSRVHCALVRTPGGLWVIDLHSRNGIAVDDTPVRWAKLTDGAELRVGRFRIAVHESQSRGAAPDHESADRRGAAAFATLAGALFPSDEVRSASADPAPAVEPPGKALFPSELMISAPPPGSRQALAAPVPELHVPPGLDPTQSMLLTMMHQFSTMQQQMFDQFQQTTVMMMQMFGHLQKDQFDLVRQELEGLRELNRELNAVQGELARHRADKSRSDETSIARTTAKNPKTDPERPKAKASRASAGTSRRKRQPAAPRGQGPRATPPRQDAPTVAAPSPRPRMPDPETPGADVPRRQPDDAVSPLAPEATSAARASAEPAGMPQDSRGSAPPSAPASAPVAAAASGPAPVESLADATTPAGVDVPPGEDVHEWLCRRFTDLQQERQSRWQRLMGVLTGK